MDSPPDYDNDNDKRPTLGLRTGFPLPFGSFTIPTPIPTSAYKTYIDNLPRPCLLPVSATGEMIRQLITKTTDIRAGLLFWDKGEIERENTVADSLLKYRHETELEDADADDVKNKIALEMTALGERFGLLDILQHGTPRSRQKPVLERVEMADEKMKQIRIVADRLRKKDRKGKGKAKTEADERDDCECAVTPLDYLIAHSRIHSQLATERTRVTADIRVRMNRMVQDVVLHRIDSGPELKNRIVKIMIPHFHNLVGELDLVLGLLDERRQMMEQALSDYDADSSEYRGEKWQRMLHNYLTYWVEDGKIFMTDYLSRQFTGMVAALNALADGLPEE